MTVRLTIALSLLIALLLGSGCSRGRFAFRPEPAGTIVESGDDSVRTRPVTNTQSTDANDETVDTTATEVRPGLHLDHPESADHVIQPVLWQLDGNQSRPYETKPVSPNRRPRGVVEKPISEVTINIEPTIVSDKGRDLPMPEVEDSREKSEFHPTGTSRQWGITCYHWAAPAIAYRPLYFEEVNPERYGFSWGSLQPFVSAGHFAGNTMLLPYHMLVDDPHCLTTPLGHDRPGSCVPWRLHRSPMPWEAVGCHVGMCSALMCLP